MSEEVSRLREALGLALTMRRLQKRYFQTRNREALGACKAAEAAFDKAAAEIFAAPLPFAKDDGAP